MLVLLLVGSMLALNSWGQSERPATPFQIERIPVTEAALPKLLQQEAKGALVRVPGAEFDAVVQQATKATTSSQPVLAEARYRAKLHNDRLDENSLTGTAEWQIRRRATDRSSLALPGLGFAVRQAKWPDGQEAELHARPGVGVQLELPPGETHTLNVDWSLRGIPEPGELRFTFNVPVAAMASLDLELPASLTPSLYDEEAILSGPTPSEPGWQTWRVTFGGVARLELGIQASKAPMPILFSRANTTLRLSETDGTAKFEFRIEAASSGFREVRFQHDASVVPTSVSVNNLAAWEVQADAEGRKGLLIRLSEPTRSALIVVNASLFIPNAPTAWTSPLFVCQNSVPRSEQLRWLVSERVDLQQWSPGGYRLVTAERFPDRSYAIDLEPLPTTDAKGVPIRPSAIVQRSLILDASATQQFDWTVNNKKESLTANTRITIREGRATVVAFRLPVGWTLERVAVAGRECDVDTSTPGIVRVPLPRPSTTGETVDVVVPLKRAYTPNPEGLALPDLVPLQMRSRNGRVRLQSSGLGPIVWSGTAHGGPQWSDATKHELDIPFESDGPFGRVVWLNRSPRLDATLRTTIDVWGEGTTLRSQLQLRSPNGPWPSVILWTPTRVQQPWVWRDQLGHRLGDALPLPTYNIAWACHGLASLTPWQAFATQAQGPSRGYWWKLDLPETKERSLTLESDYQPAPQEGIQFVAGGAAQPWVNPALPIPWLPHAECVPPTEPTTPKAVVPQPTAIPFGQVIGTLHEDGSLHVAFRAMCDGGSDRLNVELPANAVFVQAELNGRRVTPHQRDGQHLTLAVPVKRTRWALVVEYRFAATTSQSFRLPDVVPTFAVPTANIDYHWRISPRWKPIVANEWLHLPGSVKASLPFPDASHVVLGPLRQTWTELRVEPFQAYNAAAVMDHLQATFSRHKVIVDRRAYRALSSVQEWVAIDLGNVVVATAATEYHQWQQEAPLESLFRSDVEQALRDAHMFGTDATARFALLPLVANIPTSPWHDVPSDWLVLHSRNPTSTVVCIDDTAFHVGTWSIAAWPVAWVCFARRRRWRSIVLGSWLLATIGMLLFGPSSLRDAATIVLTGALLGGMLHAFAARRAVTHVPRIRGRTTTIALKAASIVGVLGATPWLWAAPEIITVHVLRSDDPATREVLVPFATWERLKQWATPNQRPAVLLTKAEYHGLVVGDRVQMTAHYRVVVHDPRPTTLTLPLGQVKLREVLLDGAPASDVDTSGNDLLIRVRGQGVHTLHLQFVLPTNTQGERESRFNIPEVPNSTLQFEVPATATRLRPINWRGAVKATNTPKSDRIDVDLGNAPQIHVRWQTRQQEVLPSVRVREAALWSISSTQAILRSAHEFRVESGSLSELKIALPGDSEVLRLDVRAEGSTSTRTTYRDWSLSPGPGSMRTLTIALHAPLTGRGVLQLELVPTYRLPERPSLRVPYVLGGENESYVAMAIDPAITWGEGTITPSTAIDVASFGQTVWQPLWGQGVSETVTQAYRLNPKEPGKLSGVLGVVNPAKQVNDTIEWSLSDDRLVGQITSRWLCAERTVLLEWYLPPEFELVDLRTPSLHRWNRVGNRVRVWLDRPMNDVTLEWRLARAVALPATGLTLAVPTPIYNGLRANTSARLHTTNGIVVRQATGESGAEIAWKSVGNQTATIAVLPGTANIDTSVDLSVESQAEAVVVHHRVQCVSAATRSHILNLRFANGAPAEVSVLPPPRWTTRMKGSGPNRVWEIVIPADHKGDESLRVTTKLAKAGSEGWALPQIELAVGARRLVPRTQTLAMPARDLTLTNSEGFQRLAVRRYQATSPNWRATVTRTDRSRQEQASVLSEITTVPQHHGWAYRACYLVRLPAESEGSILTSHLPNRLRITINQQPLAEPFAEAIPVKDQDIVEVVWHDERLLTACPLWTVEGERLATNPNWVVRVLPGQNVRGVGRQPQQPIFDQTRTFTENGPEWDVGTPVAFVVSEVPVHLQIETKAYEWTAIAPWVLCGASIGFVVLTLLSNIRFMPEQLCLLAFAGLATWGSAGGLALLLLVAAGVVRGVDLYRFVQRPKPTRPVEG